MYCVFHPPGRQARFGLSEALLLGGSVLGAFWREAKRSVSCVSSAEESVDQLL